MFLESPDDRKLDEWTGNSCSLHLFCCQFSMRYNIPQRTMLDMAEFAVCFLLCHTAGAWAARNAEHLARWA